MSVLELLRRFIALAMEFVTQRRTWKEPEKKCKQSDAPHYAPKPWSTRAEREIQEMDYMFRVNRGHLGTQTQLQGAQIQLHLQAPPKYQLHQHEETSAPRTIKRRVMIVNNPDPTDDSEGEFEMETRK